MNSVLILALVVLFPVACLLALLALDWLEDSLVRGIEADARASQKSVVEMPVRRTGPAVEAAPGQRLRPTRAAS